MAKGIRFSVGRDGQNSLPLDVMTVQYLLNCVPSSKGGPSTSWLACAPAESGW